MNHDNQTQKEEIESALDDLLALLNFDQKKLESVVAKFIDETPEVFENIGQNIAHGNWQTVAAFIHKVKTRYGYMKQKKVMSLLDEWEKDLLSSTSTKDHQELAKYFIEFNDQFIEQLKLSKYYPMREPEQKVTLPLSDKIVLIAEDDEINAMVFELFVKETGASVLLARDGQQALEYAVEKNPDLIFMDVHMPHFSGIDAIRELRLRNITCPILSLSASIRMNEREKSLDAGANEFLVKPASRESIKDALMKYLSSNKLGHA